MGQRYDMQVHRVAVYVREFLGGFDEEDDVLVKALRNVANEIEAEGRSKKHEAVPAHREE